MKLNEVFIKYMLKDITTIDQMDEFCRSKKSICTQHKEIVCHKILQFSGYKKLKDISCCKIYKELASLVQGLSKSELSGLSYISMTPSLYSLCLSYGSKDLHSFLMKQGFDVETDSRKTLKVRKLSTPVADNFKDLPTFVIG